MWVTCLELAGYVTQKANPRPDPRIRQPPEGLASENRGEKSHSFPAWRRDTITHPPSPRIGVSVRTWQGWRLDRSLCSCPEITVTPIVLGIPETRRAALKDTKCWDQCLLGVPGENAGVPRRSVLPPAPCASINPEP